MTELGLILICGFFFLSYMLTGVTRKLALKNNILDIPNSRSSHIVPTPRGGGLAFVVVFLVGISLLFCLGVFELRVFLVLFGGGCLIAGVGWLDDRQGLSAVVRLCFHFLASIWAVSWLGGVPSLNLGFTELDLSRWGSVIAVVGLVWMINLYNFMDGIDGIAGIEAVTVTAVAAILLRSQASNVGIPSLLLAVAVLGFLIWNWPPAKIFMGDIGSGFLGYILAVFALWSENSGAVPLLVWLLLLGVFIVDATVTLFKRMARGEKLYEAHRSHVYQLAIQAGYSHKQVTLTVLLINIMLGIVAAVALFYHYYLLLITLVIFAVLVVTHLLLGQVFNARIASMNVNTSNMVVKQFREEAAAIRDIVDKD
ncbi:MAG: MraY family glycosyltransferase [Syntrophomonadaceae bacterium]|jgi:Fuc2NAc and GlcNAc transferase